MIVTSPSFQNGFNIPCKFTCDGSGINPELCFKDVPNRAKSLVLIFEDPDVPTLHKKDDTWVHWLVWNIDPGTRGIGENEKFIGAVEGSNTSGTIGYEGPCPPKRSRTYYFRLYALDRKLKMNMLSTKSDVVRAMKGYILETADLRGKFISGISQPM